jgi:hypothetical protein
MAVGWVTALKIIPWGEVISHAPVVADGARKLWSAVAKKTDRQNRAPAQGELAGAAEERGTAGVEARIAALEASIEDLQSQMLASSELIAELADQNAQLVRRIDANRVHLIWLTLSSVVVGVVAVVALVLELASPGI